MIVCCASIIHAGYFLQGARVEAHQLSEELTRVKAQLHDSEQEVERVKKAVGEATGKFVKRLAIW